MRVVRSQPGLAVDAAGTEAAAGSQLNADNSSSVLVCTSADGQTWPAPATIGQGTSPTVALAPDGRAVTAWEGGPFTAPVIQASVRPPSGTWSAPVTVGTDARGPLNGIDGQATRSSPGRGPQARSIPAASRLAAAGRRRAP